MTEAAAGTHRGDDNNPHHPHHNTTTPQHHNATTPQHHNTTTTTTIHVLYRLVVISMALATVLVLLHLPAQTNRRTICCCWHSELGAGSEFLGTLTQDPPPLLLDPEYRKALAYHARHPDTQAATSPFQVELKRLPELILIAMICRDSFLLVI